MMGSAIQPSEKDVLKPCPHCGTTEQLYLASRQMNGPVYAIDCVECGYDFEPRAGMDVVAAWNKRAPTEETAA